MSPLADQLNFLIAAAKFGVCVLVLGAAGLAAYVLYLFYTVWIF